LVRPDISDNAQATILQLFPTECGPHLSNTVETLLRLTAGTPRTSKELGTVRSRRLHYFRFCNDLNLTDDLYIQHVSQLRRNWQMALYAAHLATGNNIFCRSLKAVAISGYLRDVARFLSRFSPLDARYRNTTDKTFAPCIKAVTDEIARGEKIPDRREPFTIEMWKHLSSLSSTYLPDGIFAAITDWAGCGLYGGFRNTEWAQDDSHAAFDNPILNIHGEPKAFGLNDIVWKTTNSIRLSLHFALANEDSVGRVSLTFKAQKNGENGATRLFTRNNNYSDMCFIRLLLRIARRFMRLIGKDLTKPLCICLDPLGKLRYITSTDISYVFRRAAAAVYKLDPISDAKSLDLWLSHSLRVGACVILHAMGFTDVQIMWLLRWKSNTFMTYLRNVAVLSDRQNLAFSEVEAMPHVI
jgi:hypothetical protein